MLADGISELEIRVCESTYLTAGVEVGDFVSSYVLRGSLHQLLWQD
jgi:hypothetical protein